MRIHCFLEISSTLCGPAVGYFVDRFSGGRERLDQSGDQSMQETFWEQVLWLCVELYLNITISCASQVIFHSNKISVLLHSDMLPQKRRLFQAVLAQNEPG